MWTFYTTPPTHTHSLIVPSSSSIIIYQSNPMTKDRSNLNNSVSQSNFKFHPHPLSPISIPLNSNAFQFPISHLTSPHLSLNLPSSFIKTKKMEYECKWDQNALITELKQGMELAKQLNLHLNLPPPSSSSSTTSIDSSQQLLLQRILSTYDNALLILQWKMNTTNQNQQQLPPALLESSSSPDISPRVPEEAPLSLNTAVASKKRKASSAWTNNVTVRSENGLETPCEDGHSWRKYGQKDILGATYPRSYYRCTYRNVQSCWATKQVQRSDEDPTLFDITYKGKHTCTMRNAFQSSSSSSPRTPQKQINKKPNINNNNNNNEMLLSLRKNLKVDTNNDNINMVDNVNQQMTTTTTIPTHFSFNSTSFDPISFDHSFTTFFDDNLLGGYSPKFLSPANSDSNYYFSANSCEKNGFGAVNELAEIISTNTSVSNSPVGDFSIDTIGLGDFGFDNSGFFR